MKQRLNEPAEPKHKTKHHPDRNSSTVLTQQILNHQKMFRPLPSTLIKHQSEGNDSAWEMAVQEHSEVRFGQLVVPLNDYEDTQSSFRRRAIADGTYHRLIERSRILRTQTEKAVESQHESHQKAKDVIQGPAAETSDGKGRKRQRDAYPAQEGEINKAFENELQQAMSEMDLGQKGLEQITKPSRSHFLPVAPSFIDSMMNPVRKLGGEQIDDSTLITLRPTVSPTSNSTSLRDMPPLEVRVDEQTIGKPKMISCQFICEDENLDIALPGNITDMSFSRRRVVNSRPRVSIPTINDLVAECELDRKTPNDVVPRLEVNLRVPGWALRSQPAADSNQKMPRGSEVTYRISSIERHSTLLSKFTDNTLLRYTSIEGGVRGGRRQEYVLSNLSRPSPAIDDDHDSLSSRMESASTTYRTLVKAALQLIDETQNPKLRKARIRREERASRAQPRKGMMEKQEEALDEKDRIHHEFHSSRAMNQS